MIVHISKEQRSADIWCGALVSDMKARDENRSVWILEGQEGLYPTESLCVDCLAAQAKEGKEPHPDG